MQGAQVWRWVMLSPCRLVLLQTLHPDQVVHCSFRGSYVLRVNDRTAAETGCSDPQLHRQQPLHSCRRDRMGEQVDAPGVNYPELKATGVRQADVTGCVRRFAALEIEQPASLFWRRADPARRSQKVADRYAATCSWPPPGQRSPTVPC